MIFGNVYLENNSIAVKEIEASYNILYICLCEKVIL